MKHLLLFATLLFVTRSALGANPQTYQIDHNAASPTLGQPTGTNLRTVLQKADSEFGSPLRLSATQPTADAKLNIQANRTVVGDGGSKVSPPIQGTIATFVTSTINYQTGATTGGTIRVAGGAF